MRKKIFVIAVMFVLMLPASLWADGFSAGPFNQPPKDDGWQLDYSGSGSITMGNVINPYDGGPFTPSTLNGNAVFPYCVEMSVYFSPGSTYKVNLYEDVGPLDNGGTDWFWQATYIIDKHGFSNLSSDQMATQYAVWWLNGQLAKSDVPVGLQGTFQSFLNEDPSLVSWDDSGYRYADLFNADGIEAQDQIVRTPEPMTILLLGFGLLGVGYLRRKLF